MNDDIVTRLRRHSHTEYPMGDGQVFRLKMPLLTEAADEIERLRVWLAELGERHSAQEAKHYRIIRELEAQLKAARGE